MSILLALWLARAFNRASIAFRRLADRAYRAHYRRKARRAIAREQAAERDAIAMLLANARGPSERIPASDRVDTTILRERL